jgi:nitrite reductase (NADH) small subunit
MPEEFVRVAKVGEIPSDRGKVVRVEGKEVALFNVSGTIYAIDNVCPHEGGPLGEGFLRDGVVICPWHQWKFDVRSGEMKGSAIKIGCFPVKVEGDDVLLDVSVLTASLRRNRAILDRAASGEPIHSLASDYGILPDEIEAIVRQVRVGKRLVWLGELYERQGAIYGQDILTLPYREMKGISYAAMEKLKELAELL